MEIYGKTLTLVIFFSFIISTAHSQQYAVNVYDANSSGEPKNIKTVFVDLETKTVISEIVIGHQGQIMNKTPLQIGLNSNRFMINAVMEGCFCQNSIAGEKDRARITIINRHTREIQASYADSGLGIIYFTQGPDASVFIDAESTEGPRRNLRGEYILDGSFGFRLRTPRPFDYNPLFFKGIGRFRVIEPVLPAQDLYKSWISERRFILRMNIDRNAIVDSLELENVPDRSHVLAVVDSLLYIFNQNYEFYGKTIQKNRDDDRINSHLLIFNINDFSLIDLLSIPDYPPGDYIGGEFGTADLVGPFIVYYFFEGEGIDRFAPAMLFIFDTRTNEASWLRVGWR